MNIFLTPALDNPESLSVMSTRLGTLFHAEILYIFRRMAKWCSRWVCCFTALHVLVSSGFLPPLKDMLVGGLAAPNCPLKVNESLNVCAWCPVIDQHLI